MSKFDRLMKTSTTTRLIDSAKSNINDLYEDLDSSQNGLSVKEAESRNIIFGLNAVESENKKRWYHILFHSFMNPFVAILFGIGVMSYVADEIIDDPFEDPWEEMIVLSFMIIISAILRFVEEFKSATAADKLKKMVHNTCSVKRDNIISEMNIEKLCPGDIIHLSAGDMIPADVRIISSKDLFISESALTGESVPIEKKEIDHNDHKKQYPNIFAYPNLCFMGTNVVSGSGVGIVIVTGHDTYFGSMAKDITKQRPETSFDKGISKVSWTLIKFMLIMVPIVLVIMGVTKNDWVNAVLFSLSIAVGLTPEMLPMIVNANLSKGSAAMAKHKTIVKRVEAIQNFGAMNILCTDKTGTLTQDKIILEQSLNIYGARDNNIMKYAYLNSYYQTGLRNILDNAVIEHGTENKMDYLNTEYTKIDELPFDFIRRRMSVILQDKDNKKTLFCKGAITEMLERCTHYDFEGEIKKLDDEILDKIKKVTDQLCLDGLRILAIGHKDATNNNIDYRYSIEDENNMILAGYVAFLNPAKETAETTINALHELGIEVKIITGDNEMVTRKICKEVKLNIKGVMLGTELDNLTDEELAIKAENVTIFAAILPLQKSRIIRALQSRGHVVGYLGDGINDAAALHDSDVGISVDTAVDIAKESADIILLEKSLMVLEKGVIEGRKTFGNIIKYIKMTVSSNFGNAFSVLAASIFLPFLPMLPIHLLIQNLLYDLSQTTVPWDNVDKEYLKQPRKWEANTITRFAMFLGPVSSLFDLITFGVMWFVFSANTPAEQSLFQSGWFIVGLITQVLVIHSIRTEKIPFIQSIASKPVLVMTGLVALIGMYIPFSLLGKKVSMVPLPDEYFIFLGVIIFAYTVMVQIVKKIYINKYKEWL